MASVVGYVEIYKKLLLTVRNNDEKKSWNTLLRTGFSYSITNIMHEKSVEHRKSA